MTQPSDLMRPTDAAHALAVSVRHVYTMIDNGELQSVRIGKRSVRVYRAEIEEIIGKGVVAHALAR
jgi:excisionase family DNA binding protein